MDYVGVVPEKDKIKDSLAVCTKEQKLDSEWMLPRSPVEAAGPLTHCTRFCVVFIVVACFSTIRATTFKKWEFPLLLPQFAKVSKFLLGSVRGELSGSFSHISQGMMVTSAVLGPADESPSPPSTSHPSPQQIRES